MTAGGDSESMATDAGPAALDPTPLPLAYRRAIALLDAVRPLCNGAHMSADPSIPGDVARELERLADLTGDPAYLRAARALSQLPGGRPSIDDRLALEEVQAILDDGRTKTESAALLLVAKSICRGEDPKHVAERLRKKWVALKKSSAK